MNFDSSVFRLAKLLLVGMSLMNLNHAQATSYPMPKAISRYTSPQPSEGLDSMTGSPGRTLGLERICGSCQVEKFTDECVGRLEGPSFDRDGNLWMVSPATGSIFRVSEDGHCEVVAQTPAPNATRFSRDGRLFGVDNKLGVFWIDTHTLKVTFVTDKFRSESFHGLDDLYFDSEGGLYLTDAYGSSVLNPQGQLFYLSATGEVRKLISGHLAFPNGVALSPDEKTLYIDDFESNRIIALPVRAPGDVDVDLAWVFAYLNGGRGPDSMTVDASGNLYIAHYGAGEVDVFDPHGFYYGAIRLPPGAGMVPSNVALHNGFLYITEMDQHTVWRVPVRTREISR
ncbi:SMP-30/gluconolactonase/LRE family protein [Paraburkholderia sp. Cy-641]|uniref:SMP-30/gluconolactonase/LRE family protein n=1 Tax=Paraburkholderia sp. Cy-641 TaxID=2608337 RepID=UPI0014238482|nr:SMP-30/gluconolactonase/LRE family protein [Paraburkholderia sp. Cy-641]NIF80467.1 SMP-30/gluconolactonase/LRE family protein [Paraburkholderia sp. Cy-641]